MAIDAFGSIPGKEGFETRTTGINFPRAIWHRVRVMRDRSSPGRDTYSGDSAGDVLRARLENTFGIFFCLYINCCIARTLWGIEKPMFGII